MMDLFVEPIPKHESVCQRQPMWLHGVAFLRYTVKGWYGATKRTDGTSPHNGIRQHPLESNTRQPVLNETITWNEVEQNKPK